MRYAELITLYFERSDAIRSLWTLCVIVLGGLLAVAVLRPRADPVAGVLATVLFVSFAYKNLGAIHDATLQRFAALEAIRLYAPAPSPDEAIVPAVRRSIEPTLLPPPYEGVRTFHVACDAVAVGTLWALQYRRWRRDR
jgi:hypothetical protein